MKTKLEKVGAKAYKKTMSKYSRKGEGDRHIAVKKPKHLYTGKRGIGKTDRR
jgi:nucleolar GTP-binding protein